MLHNAIAHLARFSRSPRMRRVLRHRLRVVRLSQPPQVAVLPSRRATWNHVCRDILKSCQLDGDPASVAAVTTRAARCFRADRYAAPVHCECRILCYFAAAQHAVPPISYVGVSARSCASCAAVFAAHNLAHDKKYFTHASRGTFSFPWALPAMKDTPPRLVLEQMVESIGSSLKRNGIAHDRRKSDGGTIIDSHG